MIDKVNGCLLADVDFEQVNGGGKVNIPTGRAEDSLRRVKCTGCGEIFMANTQNNKIICPCCKAEIVKQDVKANVVKKIVPVV
ncbi:MAG: hypothetical protein K6E98_09605 [Lachnospiraceae bacterium]|nr:hypothetical protein [Lachnospiraceae bacterium]